MRGDAGGAGVGMSSCWSAFRGAGTGTGTGQVRDRYGDRHGGLSPTVVAVVATMGKPGR